MTFHNCGGTILAGPDYRYCDRCAAFAYDGNPVPSGIDRDANRAAFDAGEAESPDAETTEDGWRNFKVSA